MNIEDIVNLFVNQGLGVACVIYLIYFQNTTMKEMLSTLTTISERLAIIEERVKDDKQTVNTEDLVQSNNRS